MSELPDSNFTHKLLVLKCAECEEFFSLCMYHFITETLEPEKDLKSDSGQLSFPTRSVNKKTETHISR